MVHGRKPEAQYKLDYIQHVCKKPHSTFNVWVFQNNQPPRALLNSTTNTVAANEHNKPWAQTAGLCHMIIVRDYTVTTAKNKVRNIAVTSRITKATRGKLSWLFTEALKTNESAKSTPTTPLGTEKQYLSVLECILYYSTRYYVLTNLPDVSAKATVSNMLYDGTATVLDMILLNPRTSLRSSKLDVTGKKWATNCKNFRQNISLNTSLPFKTAQKRSHLRT